jgi:hypothetical protein
MNYFAQSALENICEKVFRLREKGAAQRRIIITTSAFPPDVTLDLAKMLDDFVLKTTGIVLTFKAAKILGDSWRNKTENKKICEELDKRYWIDDTGNLTRYRSAGLQSMEGWSYVCMSARNRLLRFKHSRFLPEGDPKNVWQGQMEGSFKTMIREARCSRA